MDKGQVLAAVCQALGEDEPDEARTLLNREYPFAPQSVVERNYGLLDSARVFVRDGFIDRYTSQRLVFPPVLRVISLSLPAEFPYHPNWKTDVTHPAFWEMSATIDHVVPVTRGGPDDESNLVTTSMARNSAKANWTLGELGWTLHTPGDFAEWDGLLQWFVDYAATHPRLLDNSSIRGWYKAGKHVLARL